MSPDARRYIIIGYAIPIAVGIGLAALYASSTAWGLGGRLLIVIAALVVTPIATAFLVAGTVSGIRALGVATQLSRADLVTLGLGAAGALCGVVACAFVFFRFLTAD